MQTIKLLLVEDDPLLGEALHEALSNKGFAVTLAATGADALAAAHDASFDLLLQDVRLPDVDGLELLHELLSRHPQCHALVMTGQGTVEMAVKAMKLGAYDFLTKPFSIDVLLLKLERVIDYKGMEKQLERLSDDSATHCRIITRSPAMRNLLDTVAIVAASEVPLLIRGEYGTGKKMLAETIHALSARKDQSFVRVNCEATPAALIEQELFGVAKGYEGAERSKTGILESGAGGTLCLEEVDGLPMETQTSLLRLLEEQTFCKLGGTTRKNFEQRLICTTTKDLKLLSELGQFRKELLYRLNVVTLAVPPLRERREDIPLLIAHFITLFSKTPQQKTSLSPRALDALLQLPWPGNIRELSNLIEQLTLLYPGQRIREQQLPLDSHAPLYLGTQFEKIEVGSPLRDAVAVFERRYIMKVLESMGGHKSRAAEVLGISRKVLWEKLKRPNPDNESADDTNS